MKLADGIAGRAPAKAPLVAKLTTDTILNAPTAGTPTPAKLAIFDFDWTLVRPRKGRTFPRDVDDWQWTQPSVPAMLQGIAATHTVVILTDQTKQWKLDQIRAALAAAGLPDTTVIVGNQTKKPSTALFMQVFPDFDYMTHDAYFVGDAAGRPGDWAATDLQFARNLRVPFMTPEQFFPVPAVEPQAQPTQSLIEIPGTQEVVIMVGCPASGKSTVARTVFEPAGYTIISGDDLKTVAKMKKAAAVAVAAGKSVVFDSTAGTREKRAEFIAFAQVHGIPVRIVWMDTPTDIAIGRNTTRATAGGTKVPTIVFSVYKKHFVEPSMDEGVAAIIRI